MKEITVTKKNGIKLSAPETWALNLNNIVSYSEDNDGFCVVRYDESSRNKRSSKSLTLNIDKATFEDLVGFVSTVTVTARNGIALDPVETKGINLHRVIYFYDNASTKCVVRYDEIPGNNSQPESLTLSISATAFAVIVGYDATVTLITGAVYNLTAGGTTSTRFNSDYLSALRDTYVVVAGTKTACVELEYVDGFINKYKYASGALSSLVSSNLAEMVLVFPAVDNAVYTIDRNARTIGVLAPLGTTITALVASFTTSPSIYSIKVDGVSQATGVTANNFTTAKTYVVVAQDTITTRNFVVSVTVDTVGHLAEMLTMTHASQVGSTVIDDTAGTIVMHMPSGTNVSAFAMTFTVSPNATVKVGTISQSTGSTTNDFGTAKTYVVTSEDTLTTKSYVATVVIDA